MAMTSSGCQRSDPKSGGPADYPEGLGPQGDAIRIYNYVRLVRDIQCGEPGYVSELEGDFHGAGGARFDTKVEGGPLGEGGERYYNYVRLVRGQSTQLCQQLTNSGDYDCDCNIDFLDFASLAAKWLQIDCDDCDGIDITQDGNVDIDDLMKLVENWLEG